MNKLKDYQREDIDYIKANGLRCLIANSQGTGKTATALRSIVESHETSLPGVVICPASVTENWSREAKMWAPGVSCIIIEDGLSPIPKRRTPNTLYILSWALLDARLPDLRRLGLKTVVADEAHLFKNKDSQRSQALQELVQGIPGLLLLSGTPIINNESELRVLKDLFGTAEPPMIRRLLEDVAPEVPPKSRSYVYVQLREEDQQEYERAVKDFETWLRIERSRLTEEGVAAYEIERTLAAEALVKVGYLRRLVGEAKVHAAVDWIAWAVRLGEPVVVFTEHQDPLRRLEKGLRKANIAYGTLEGSTPSGERQAVIDGFQRHGFPVFLGTKAAMVGITLTASRHLLFVERFFTSAEEEQAEDRIRRLGQRFQTTIWFLHAVGTIDDRLDAIVRGKRQIIRTAIGSADIAETATKNVESLLGQWNQHTAVKDVEIQPLGHGIPLPALPKPKDTFVIQFSGPRWNPRAAAIWCRMNGYQAGKTMGSDISFRVGINPVEYFKPGQFEFFAVCKDIRIVKGIRVSKATERRFAAAKRRMA